METQQPYKQQFLDWFNSLSKEAQESFARDILAQRKPGILPEIDATEKQSLAEYLLEARAYVKNPEFEEIQFKIQEF